MRFGRCAKSVSVLRFTVARFRLCSFSIPPEEPLGETACRVLLLS